MKLHTFLLWGLLFFVLVVPASADTHNATSCNQVDVQDAIDLANDNDIVIVPSGNCTWTTVVQNTPSVLINGKSITLMGAGQTSTIISDGTDNDYSSQEVPLLIQGTGAQIVVVRDMWFKDNEDNSAGLITIITDNTAFRFRITNCKFTDSDGLGIKIFDDAWGVIDHSTFVDVHMAVSTLGLGSTSWGTNLALGTDKAVYVEDNNFSSTLWKRFVGDGYNGARLVFRHNSIANSVISTHDACYTGFRSVLSWEIYNNTFSQSVASIDTFIGIRGGTGIIFNNIVSGGTYNSFVKAQYYRTCDTHPCWNYKRCNGTQYKVCSESTSTRGYKTCTVDGDCLGGTCTKYACSVSGTPCTNVSDCPHANDTCNIDNYVDGTGTFGYIGIDQIGAFGRTSSPAYEWNNCKTSLGCVDGSANDLDWGLQDDSSCSSPKPSDIVQLGRDVFDDTQKPRYTPYIYPHPLVVPVGAGGGEGGGGNGGGSIDDGDMGGGDTADMPIPSSNDGMPKSDFTRTMLLGSSFALGTLILSANLFNRTGTFTGMIIGGSMVIVSAYLMGLL